MEAIDLNKPISPDNEPAQHTPAQRLAARSEIGTLRAELGALDSVRYPEGHAERTRRLDRIQALSPIAYAPEPAAPTGPTWREHRQFRQENAELRREMDLYPENHPVRAEIVGELAARAADFHGREPNPGAVTWQDFDRAPSTQQWTSHERSEFRLWGEASGATPTEAIVIAGAWEQERAAAQTSEPIDWKQRWGADYERKHAAFERALKQIPDERYAQFADAGLRNAPRTVELLAALGERLGRGAR